MRRFIDNEGEEIDSAHVGLGAAFLEGGLVEVWNEVDRTVPSATCLSHQNKTVCFYSVLFSVTWVFYNAPSSVFGHLSNIGSY